MKKENLKNILLSASFLFPALALANTDYASEQFAQALENYNNKSFAQSYNILQNYSKSEVLNKEQKFMLARSAYELGYFQEAQSLYQELLKESPDNNRVKLELAQSLFQQKKYDEARVLYEEVLQDPTLPSSVKRNVELTLNSLNRSSQTDFVRATIGIGYGYDSNVDNLTDDEYVYWAGLPFKTEDKKSDHVVEYLAALNHTKKLQDNLTWDNKLVGYMQKFNHERDNDISLVVLGTGISYYKEKTKYSLGFDYNSVWLDNSTYLYNYILTPSIDHQISKDLLYKGKVKLIKKDFKQSEYNFRDSFYFEFSNALSLMTKHMGLNTFTLSLGKDDKDDGSHHNVDYEFVSLRYDNLYPLTNQTLLSTGLEIYSDKYQKEEAILYQNKKSNDKFIFDLGLIHSINKNLSLGANFKYINNDSNQNIYKYDKYVVKTNIYYTF